MTNSGFDEERFGKCQIPSYLDNREPRYTRNTGVVTHESATNEAEKVNRVTKKEIERLVSVGKQEEDVAVRRDDDWKRLG